LQADMACTLSKEGYPLSMIAQLMKVEPDTVLNLIARKTQLDKSNIAVIFDLMEAGKHANEMQPSFPVEALKIFVPEPPQTEMSRGYKTKVVRSADEEPGVVTNFGFDFELEDDVASMTEGLTTVVGELPVKRPRAPEESKSPAVRRENQTRNEAVQRIEPQKWAVKPQYFYSPEDYDRSLFRTKLSTGETRKERVNHKFKFGSVWCEVAGGDIYFTGGENLHEDLVNEVVRASGSSLEVTQMAGMLRGRAYHGSVYDDNYLYAIGSTALVGECERLVVSEDRWEALPRLPRGLVNLSVIVMKKTQCLYALGGRCSRALDLIQRLSLRRLEWDTQSLRLPSSAFGIACFKQDESKVWFVEYGELYCLNAENECAITLIKEVGRIQSFFGPSYYYRGYLYCSNSGGAAYRTEIGQL